jgi:predicted permease
VSWRSVAGSRFRALFRRDRLERELDEEVRFHLEMQADDNMRAGMDADEARRAAMRSFGGRDAMKETYRARRTIHFVETMAQDVRYAVRTMWKSPGFTAIAVVSLGVGIGANAAVFSVADLLLLKPLAIARPDGLLTVGVAARVESLNSLAASYREFVDVRERTTAFEGLSATAFVPAGFAPDASAQPTLKYGLLVSGNFFEVMGVAPQMGRGFRADEDQVPARDAVVVLDHDFWEQQLGGDSAAIGRSVRLNGVAFTVVGVAPPSFRGLNNLYRTDFYVPIMMWPALTTDDRVRPLESRELRDVVIRGRLKPGVTIERAQSELSVVGLDLERAYPDTNRGRALVVRTELQNRMVSQGPLWMILLLLLTLSASVLVVACANVAGLLTTRALGRAREFALRLALGGGRLRLVRQLVTESVLLAGAGALLGLAVGYGAIRLFRLVKLPADPPISAPFAFDGRVAMVGMVAALVSAVLFGLLPAVHATRADLTSAMKVADAGAFGRRRQWGRTLLVGGQVAVSVVLLVVALFVYRGFEQQIAGGPGYRLDHLLTMGFDTRFVRYTDAQARRFFEDVADRARLTPGVTSATLSSVLPMGMEGAATLTIVPEGFRFPAGIDTVSVLSADVDERYFETLGLTILGGRGFRVTDAAGTPIVAVVNEQVARRYWPGQDPLGKRFRLDGANGPWAQVVGVVKTSKYLFIMEPPREFVYLAFRQRPVRRAYLVAESAGDPAALAAPLREMVHRLDAGQPIFNVHTMEAFYDLRNTNQLTMVAGLITAMGTMALALSVAGLYGLVAYAVGRRTREIGIRMAIGAAPFEVLRMVLRQGMALAAAGLGIGLLASLGVGRLLGAVFPGGGPGGDGRLDLLAFPIVAAAVLAITFVASYVPARRASRVNPTEALRHE